MQSLTKPTPLHAVPAKPKVEIGSRHTGRREVFYCTRTGAYSESMVALDVYARLLQNALCPPFVARKRQPADVRQKG